MLFRDIKIIDEDFKTRSHMYVRTEGEFITYVGGKEPERIKDEEIYDGRSKVLMPGFYNAHCHVPMTLLRGYGEGLGLQRWLNEKIFPFEARLDEEAVYWGSCLGAMELAASGSVSISDMYFFIEGGVARALNDCGMKGNICHGISSFDPDVELNSMKGYMDTLSLDRAVRRGEFGGASNGDGTDAAGGRGAGALNRAGAGTFPGDGSRIKADMCMHAEYTSTEGLARQIAEAARALHKPIHVHVSETKSEHEECKGRHGGLTPVQYLRECGFFESKVQAAHCVWLENEDIEIMREAGAYVVHNPSSNLKLGSGIMPLKKYLDAGLNVALGTDGASSNNNLNMMEEMHMAAMLARGVSMDANAVPAGTVLKMATRNGALCQGREDCGLIKEGFRADLVVLDLDRPHMQPDYDTVANIVFSAQNSDIVLTMVDGREVYRNGEYMCADREKVIYEADRYFHKILAEL